MNEEDVIIVPPVCPGPETRSRYYNCDGAACPVHADWRTCRPAIEQRGYIFRLTEKGQARENENVSDTSIS